MEQNLETLLRQPLSREMLQEALTEGYRKAAETGDLLFKQDDYMTLIQETGIQPAKPGRESFVKGLASIVKRRNAHEEVEAFKALAQKHGYILEDGEVKDAYKDALLENMRIILWKLATDMDIFKEEKFSQAAQQIKFFYEKNKQLGNDLEPFKKEIHDLFFTIYAKHLTKDAEDQFIIKGKERAIGNSITQEDILFLRGKLSEYLKICFEKDLRYKRMREVLGWIGFPVDNDGWFYREVARYAYRNPEFHEYNREFYDLTYLIIAYANEHTTLTKKERMKKSTILTLEDKRERLKRIISEIVPYYVGHFKRIKYEEVPYVPRKRYLFQEIKELKQAYAENKMHFDDEGFVKDIAERIFKKYNGTKSARILLNHWRENYRVGLFKKEKVPLSESALSILESMIESPPEQEDDTYDYQKEFEEYLNKGYYDLAGEVFLTAQENNQTLPLEQIFPKVVKSLATKPIGEYDYFVKQLYEAQEFFEKLNQPFQKTAFVRGIFKDALTNGNLAVASFAQEYATKNKIKVYE